MVHKRLEISNFSVLHADSTRNALNSFERSVAHIFTLWTVVYYRFAFLKTPTRFLLSRGYRPLVRDEKYRFDLLYILVNIRMKRFPISRAFLVADLSVHTRTLQMVKNPKDNSI